MSPQVSHSCWVYSSCLGQAELVQKCLYKYIRRSRNSQPLPMWQQVPFMPGKAYGSERPSLQQQDEIPDSVSRARLCPVRPRSYMCILILLRGATAFLSSQSLPNLGSADKRGSTSQKCLCHVFKCSSGMSETLPHRAILCVSA